MGAKNLIALTSEGLQQQGIFAWNQDKAAMDELVNNSEVVDFVNARSSICILTNPKVAPATSAISFL